MLAVVLGCNTHWAPYYRRYEEILDNSQVEYDLILWNREGLTENVKGHLIEYSMTDETNNGSFSKIHKFFSFACFVKNKLKTGKYSKVIFLGTYAGVPAFISRFLKHKFKNRYWIDIRDITYETFKPFYWLEKVAIENSKEVVISSKGFAEYLPKLDYRIIHNIDPMMEDLVLRYHHTQSDKIRISYIGNIGYWDSCKEFIDIFGNDARFEMHFIGNGVDKVQTYCEEHGIKNTLFKGKFPRERTVDYYNDTDVVYNVYGNGTTNVRTAASNKLYYSLRLGLPLLVSTNTYMEDICQEYNVGISFENSQNFPDKLYFWLKRNEGKMNFEKAWEQFNAEDRRVEKDIINFVNN